MRYKLYSVIFATLFAVASVSAQTPMKTFCGTLKKSTMPSDASMKWVQFGPGMSGNNKTAIWHPTDPKVLFIAPNMGISYRSTDGGVTYETILDADGPAGITNNRGPRGIMCADFSRQNPDFGMATSLSYESLYSTQDRGKSWSRIESVLFEKTYLSHVCVDPKDDNIWYVGSGSLKEHSELFFSLEYPHGTSKRKTVKGMIWRSNNKGKSWRLINNGIDPEAQIETLMVDPKNSNIVYAATTYGFYKSENYGKTWVDSSKGIDNNVIRAFTSHYDAANDKLSMYVIAAIKWKLDGDSIADDGGGMYRSDDRGESWTCINGDIAIDMSQFEYSNQIKKCYVHAAAYYFGMSDNEFAVRYPKMPKSITQSFNQIEVDPNDPDNLYVVNVYANLSRNNFKPGQMWRSKDGGKHWYVTFRNGKNWVSGRNIEYWKSRNNPIGNNATFLYLNEWMGRDDYDSKSTNMARFNCDGTILHSQMSKISVFSYDKGDTWIDIDDVVVGHETYVGAGNSNMPGHGFYQDLRLPGQVFCCAGENNLWITREGGEKVRKGAQAVSVHHLLGTEQSLSCYAIHPQDTTIRFSMFFRQAGRGELLKSTDSGKSWKRYGVAIPQWEVKQHSGDQPSHQLNLIIDKDTPDNMYFCVPKDAGTIGYVGNSEAGFGVNRSFDGGRTWMQCNIGLPKPFDVTSICFDPKNNNTLYATVQGKGGGLYVSTDKGSTWKAVRTAAAIKGEFGVNDIHFDVDGVCYITTGHKRAAMNGGGAWVSRDGMKSWQRIFDFPYVFRIETAHYDPKVIMISTLPNMSNSMINAGTYLSEDGGKSWIKFNTGNGQSDRVNDIAIDNYTKGKFYCSTFGSGWYVATK